MCNTMIFCKSETKFAREHRELSQKYRSQFYPFIHVCQKIILHPQSSDYNIFLRSQ